ncbi:YraN family protein [Candidatus Babeliales bacterium]|nr:YraN family protein [Candidatus Babeliales bacterium]
MNYIKQHLGNAGESAVTDSLIKDGYTIVARNYRIRGGEIDIIVRKDEYLAFVEVKTRKKSLFPLSEVITVSKQKTIIRTAKHFLATYKEQTLDTVYRFDVALVEGSDLIITYIPNAFAGE